jgi:hypothetical protein
MTITYEHQGNIIIATKHNAINLFRVLRSLLWKQGNKRDPQVGDMIDGVTIVSINI